MSDSSSSVPEPAIQVAARLLAEGRPALAVERLAALVAEAPIYAAAHVLHATALEAAGRPEDALEAWGRASALVPRSPLVHRERGRLLALRREPLDAAAESLPPAVASGTAIGVDELDSGNETEEWLDEGRELHPGSLSDAHESGLEDAPAAPTKDQPVEEEPDAAADHAPSLEYGALNPMDASDLFFGDPSPPSAAHPPLPDAPHPPEPELAGDEAVPDSPSQEAPRDAFGESELLPPEGDVPIAPDPDLSAPDALDASGWEVVAEEAVPTPPHDVHAEPDVISPEADAPPPDYAVADELDALIAQLEDAPRIRPDPEFRGPEVAFDQADVDEMASETLAKIYAAQHQYVEAALIYEKLAAREPDRADEMRRRAAEMREHS